MTNLLDEKIIDMDLFKKSTSGVISNKNIRHNSGNSDIININRKYFGKSEVELMDDNDALEKYLDKVDQDRRDQEERLSKNMNLMEQRITEERRLSEERMEKRFNQVMSSIEKTNDKIDEKVSRIEDKIDNTNKWIIGTCIATILAVAAIAASVWFK